MLLNNQSQENEKSNVHLYLMFELFCFTGVRVGFVQESGPTPISKAGKQPSEDPSVGVIKGIMK